MSTSLRATVGGLAVLVAVGAFLLLRPDSEPRRATSAAATQPAPIEGAPGQSTAAERAAEAEAESESESEGDATSETAPQREREPTVPVVRARGGRPVGGVRQISARRGERVRFRVTADARDHVHVHGYDLTRDVGPGRSARFSFEASLEGLFEVELEDAGQQIVELEVRP